MIDELNTSLQSLHAYTSKSNVVAYWFDMIIAARRRRTSPISMMSFDPDEDDDHAICIWDEKCFKASWTKLALAMANYWRRLVVVTE